VFHLGEFIQAQNVVKGMNERFAELGGRDVE
jgi:hypothetical protein